MTPLSPNYLDKMVSLWKIFPSCFLRPSFFYLIQISLLSDHHLWILAVLWGLGSNGLYQPTNLFYMILFINLGLQNNHNQHQIYWQLSLGEMEREKMRERERERERDSQPDRRIWEMEKSDDSREIYLWFLGAFSYCQILQIHQKTIWIQQKLHSLILCNSFILLL